MSTLRFGHQSASVAGQYALRRNQYIEWISLDSLHGKIVDCLMAGFFALRRKIDDGRSW